MGVFDETHLENNEKTVKGEQCPPGVPGIGYKLDSNNNFDNENKKLVNVDEGVKNQDAVKKHQLDAGLQTKPNTNTVILRDGTQNMASDLDLNNSAILNIKIPRQQQNDTMPYNFFEHNFFVSMYGDTNCMTRKIFNIGSNTHRDQVINRAFVEGYYLRRDGYFSMSGNLNTNNNKIINISNPNDANDCANKQYVDSKNFHNDDSNIDLKEQYNFINSKQ